MRSNSMAWLFEQAGVQCTVLKGGYKAYRNYMLAQFANIDNLVVIDGPTGSGKTEILHQLRALGEQVIDLEAMAAHRGSAFGGLGMSDQPTTQQFQNNLFHCFEQFSQKRTVWVEAESLTIGKVYLPLPFWLRMNKSRTVEIQAPLPIRAQRLVADYGHLPTELLAQGIKKITDQFGGNRVKLALEMLNANNLNGVALLLLDYYDERYVYGRKKHGQKPWAELTVEQIEPLEIAHKLVALVNQNG
jgi:tRNA 2-selenouridine synthase